MEPQLQSNYTFLSLVDQTVETAECMDPPHYMETLTQTDAPTTIPAMQMPVPPSILPRCNLQCLPWRHGLPRGSRIGEVDHRRFQASAPSLLTYNSKQKTL